MIRIAIVEDDADDAAQLAEMTRTALERLGERGEIGIFYNPLYFLDNYNPDYDIIFMDIEMPEMNGMEVARRLRQKDTNVVLIFVTNVARFAVDGYTVDATDFIVKPTTSENLYTKLDRAIKNIAAGRGDRIIIRCRSGACVENASRIKYIEVIDHKLLFHTMDKVIAATGSLSKLEAQLKSRGFSKCNSCYLVNLAYVTEINNKIAYVGGEELVISRGRLKPFMKDLADKLGGII